MAFPGIRRGGGNDAILCFRLCNADDVRVAEHPAQPAAPAADAANGDDGRLAPVLALVDAGGAVRRSRAGARAPHAGSARQLRGDVLKAASCRSTKSPGNARPSPETAGSLPAPT